MRSLKLLDLRNLVCLWFIITALASTCAFLCVHAVRLRKQNEALEERVQAEERFRSALESQDLGAKPEEEPYAARASQMTNQNKEVAQNIEETAS